MSRARDVLVCALIVAVLAAILFPVFAQSKGKKRQTCLHHAKAMGNALVMYVDDSDRRLPDRDRWMDAELPYVRNESLYRCPQAKAPYGYAFNAILDKAKQARFPDPEKIPAIYDSVVPIRNASDPFASLPSPGRHGGGNNVAYLDGHARWRK